LHHFYAIWQLFPANCVTFGCEDASCRAFERRSRLDISAHAPTVPLYVSTLAVQLAGRLKARSPGGLKLDSRGSNPIAVATRTRSPWGLKLDRRDDPNQIAAWPNAVAAATEEARRG
jgi:hypothetical protein